MSAAAAVADEPDMATVPTDHERLDPARIEGHRARLYRAAYALCGTREDAEDLVQDTFERVLRRPRYSAASATSPT